MCVILFDLNSNLPYRIICMHIIIYYNFEINKKKNNETFC